MKLLLPTEKKRGGEAGETYLETKQEPPGGAATAWRAKLLPKTKVHKEQEHLPIPREWGPKAEAGEGSRLQNPSLAGNPESHG